MTGTRHLRMGDKGSEIEREELAQSAPLPPMWLAPNSMLTPPSAGSEVRASPNPYSFFLNGFHESFPKASAAGQDGLA